MARIDGLFKLMKEQGASDLHLSPDSPPIFRLHGEMVRQNFLTTRQLREYLTLMVVLTHGNEDRIELA